MACGGSRLACVRPERVSRASGPIRIAVLGKALGYVFMFYISYIIICASDGLANSQPCWVPTLISYQTVTSLICQEHDPHSLSTSTTSSGRTPTTIQMTVTSLSCRSFMIYAVAQRKTNVDFPLKTSTSRPACR